MAKIIQVHNANTKQDKAVCLRLLKGYSDVPWVVRQFPNADLLGLFFRPLLPLNIQPLHKMRIPSGPADAPAGKRASNCTINLLTLLFPVL